MADDGLPILTKEEYLALIDEKAADWRAITQMSTSFLAFAGALFAAGVGQKSAFVVVLTPVPLLFGVFHMVRNARLQLQMITYLVVFSPFRGPSWERDINEVRPVFWSEYPKSKLMAAAQRRVEGKPRLLETLRALEHPSSWHIWLAIAFTIGLIVDLVPLLADGYHDAWTAFWIGLTVLLVGVFVTALSAAKVESVRVSWVEQWTRHQSKLSAEAEQLTNTTANQS